MPKNETPLTRPGTGDRAGAALRASVGADGVERPIADRRWLAAPGGWALSEPLRGWRSRVEPVAGGVRVAASRDNGEPAASGDRRHGAARGGRAIDAPGAATPRAAAGRGGRPPGADPARPVRGEGDGGRWLVLAAMSPENINQKKGP